tara:strand:- start:14869 stop:15336 length:468 start_codon:yes stop_codon:yes gene_type:complete
MELLSFAMAKQEAEEQENIDKAVVLFKKSIPSSEDIVFIRKDYAISIFCSNNKGYLSEIWFHPQKATYKVLDTFILDFSDPNLIIEEKGVFRQLKETKIEEEKEIINNKQYSTMSYTTKETLMEFKNIKNLNFKTFIYDNLKKCSKNEELRTVKF